MSAKPVKTIVFDWNGTLLDDAIVILSCVNNFLERYGRAPVDMETFRRLHVLPFEKFYANFGFSETEAEQLIANGNDAFHSLYEPMAEKVDLREGAKQTLTLAHAQGVKNMILSNHLQEPIRVQMKRRGVDVFMDEILAYQSGAQQFKSLSKGDKLRHFMQEQRRDPKLTIIVGDTMEEVEIAHTLGLISIAVTGGYMDEARLRKAKPDYLLTSLRAMPAVLKERGFIS